MDINMDGKLIKAVYWPDTEIEQGRHLVAGAECGVLYLSAAYHGDHSEFWVVQQKNGVEVSRHNTRFMETIVWE